MLPLYWAVLFLIKKRCTWEPKLEKHVLFLQVLTLVFVFGSKAKCKENTSSLQLIRVTRSLTPSHHPRIYLNVHPKALHATPAPHIRSSSKRERPRKWTSKGGPRHQRLRSPTAARHSSLVAQWSSWGPWSDCSRWGGYVLYICLLIHIKINL